MDLGRYIAHRGPDGQGQLSARGTQGAWSFFHSRLAIVDLTDAGAQPITSVCGDWALSFNGEIYNHEELRRLCRSRGHIFRSSMDGEVILHLWEDEGRASLARLNGIFSVALGNTRTGEVVLVRDPLGVKPLFYCQGAGGDLWFASEPRALRASGAPIGSPDLTALAQFLTFLWIPDPRTPWARMHTMLPGTGLHVRNGQFERFRYSDLAAHLEGAHRDPSRVDPTVLEGLFRDACAQQLMSDVPIGLMASGGIDSSLLWWATAPELKRCYTIRWPPEATGERLDEDAATVRLLARGLPTEVRFLDGEQADPLGIPRSGDLFADPAFELTRLIAKQARHDGIPVLLSGQGADEVFGGYRRHVLARLAGRVYSGRAGTFVSRQLAARAGQTISAEYAARLAKASAQRDPLKSYMELCSYSTSRQRAMVLDCHESEVTDDVVWQRHQEVFDSTPPAAGLLRRYLFVDLSVYLPGLGLAYVDRAGMDFGVEIRVPWLDLELVKWSLALPSAALVSGLTSKVMPRRLAERRLPRVVTTRPKRGFAAPTRPADRSSDQPGFRQTTYFDRARRLAELFLGDAGSAVLSRD